MLDYETVSDLLDYNPDTGELRWKVNRRGCAKAGNVAGHVRSDGYVAVSLNDKSYLAHRLAWLLYHGQWPEDGLDHISHDKTDNRIKNLREATLTVNQRNRPLNSNNTSGVCGVCWDKQANKWQSRIYLDSRNVHLGFFDDFDEAVAARQAANKQYNFHENHGKVL